MKAMILLFTPLLFGCDMSTSPEVPTSPVGSWRHESYQEAFRSTLHSRVELKDDGTLFVREAIIPVPEAEGGVRYFIPDTVTTVTIEYQGIWREDAAEILHFTFSDRILFFDSALVEHESTLTEPDDSTNLFWELTDLTMSVAYQFNYSFTNRGDLVLFFLSDDRNTSPLFVTLFDGGVGSLFSR